MKKYLIILAVSIVITLLTVWLYTNKTVTIESIGGVSIESKVAPASVYKSTEALKSYIKRVTLEGYIPHFNENIDTQAVTKAYLEIYNESNADKTKFKNLWEGIRDGEQRKGNAVGAVKQI